MAFSPIAQLIARGAPSPITSALQGVQAGAQMIPSIQMARLAPLLRQAQLAKAQQPAPVQGSFAQNIAGIMQLAKQRGLTPIQTAKILDQFQQSQQKGGISLGLSPSGQLTSLQIGGAASPISGVSGAGGLLSPTAVIPNTGQTSRGTQGATKVDIDTGNVTSIPTRATGSFLQQGVVGANKLKAALNDYVNGMLPYAGGGGHIQFGLDLAKASLGDKDAQSRLSAYYTAKGNRIALATDAARMASGKAPSESEIHAWQNTLNPGFFESPDRFKRHMKGFSSMIDKWKGISQQGLETGIPVSQLNDNELQTLKNQQQVAASQPTLGQLFFPDDKNVAALHALKQPQHLVNGIPHLKPEQTAKMKAPSPPVQRQQTYMPNQEDLEFTAKKHGISVDEVRRRLGIK